MEELWCPGRVDVTSEREFQTLAVGVIELAVDTFVERRSVTLRSCLVVILQPGVAVVVGERIEVSTNDMRLQVCCKDQQVCKVHPCCLTCRWCSDVVDVDHRNTIEMLSSLLEREAIGPEANIDFEDHAPDLLLLGSAIVNKDPD